MNWSGLTEKVRTWMASLLERVWLPSLTSIGVPADQLPPFWGKITPGTLHSINFGAPGANGSYTNGKTISLLGVLAVCNTRTPESGAESPRANAVPSNVAVPLLRRAS